MRTGDWLNDFRYALKSPANARARLATVTAELLSLHRELAMTQVAEKQKRREVFAQSNETSVSGRDREADAYVGDYLDDIIRMKGDIAAYSEERDQLRFFIEHEAIDAVVDQLPPADS